MSRENISENIKAAKLGKKPAKEPKSQQSQLATNKYVKAKSSTLSKKSVAMFLMSITDPLFDKDHFAAMTDLLVKLKEIEPDIKIIALVADTLQKYNDPQFLKNTTEADKLATNYGQTYIETHAVLFNLLKKNGVEIQRWNQWTNHPDFQNERKFIQKLSENLDSESPLFSLSKEFQHELDKTVQVFMNRKSRDSRGNKNPDLIRMYLLEELAAFILWAKNGVTHLLHPSGMPAVFSWVYKRVISTEIGEFCKLETIDLKDCRAEPDAQDNPANLVYGDSRNPFAQKKSKTENIKFKFEISGEIGGLENPDSIKDPSMEAVLKCLLLLSASQGNRDLVQAANTLATLSLPNFISHEESDLNTFSQNTNIIFTPGTSPRTHAKSPLNVSEDGNSSEESDVFDNPEHLKDEEVEEKVFKVA